VKWITGNGHTVERINESETQNVESDCRCGFYFVVVFVVVKIGDIVYLSKKLGVTVSLSEHC